MNTKYLKYSKLQQPSSGNKTDYGIGKCLHVIWIKHNDSLHNMVQEESSYNKQKKMKSKTIRKAIIFCLY